MAKKILITETVLRDAHQSLLATRMPLSDMVPILENLYFDSKAFLAPIKKVRLADDGCEESSR